MTKFLLKVVVGFVFLFLGTKTYAQRDLIITQAGEEIRCKILDETPTRFIYAYLGSKNKILRNEIFKNLVSSFKYSYYSTDILKNDKLIEKPKSGQSNRSEGLVPSKEEVNSAVEVKNKNDKSTDQNSTNKTSDAKQDNSLIKSSEDKENNLKNNDNSIKNVDHSTDNQQENTTQIKTNNSGELLKVEASNKNEKSKVDISPLADAAPVSEFKNYLKYRIGAKGGLGNIVAPNNDTSPYGLYKEKLLRGWMFGVDAAYFFKDKIGLGATYTNFQANNSTKSLDYPNLFTNEAIVGGQLSNKVSHKFIGPTFLYRKSIDYKTFAILTISPGMHLYTDKGLTNNAAFKFKGQAYGAAATLGLDFLLGNDIFGRDIILSLEGGYNYGQITTIDNAVEKVKLATPINLNRLDFTIGLRFTRFPMYLR